MSIGQQNKNNLMFYGAVALIAVLVGGLVFTQMKGKSQSGNNMVTYNLSPQSSLMKPLLTDEEIKEFVARSAADILTFEHRTYKEDLLHAREYFTETGWVNIQDAFMQSGMLKHVVDREMDVNSIVSAEPTITSKGVEDGVYTWIAESPFLMVYAVSGATVEERMNLRMRVQRSDSSKNIDHVGITQIIISAQ